MKFDFRIPRTDGTQLEIALAAPEQIFVLGANGTGKSSLMHRFSSMSNGNFRRISASRQTWLQSSSLEFSPSQKISLEQQAKQWDNKSQSRWMEQNAQIRSGLTLYDLIDAENIDARAIAAALRAGRREEADLLAQKSAPIATINQILRDSNIPVEISVHGGDRLMATKNGSAPYGAAELSDGERNALLISADVLTARPGTVLIIDEPERHLHRSIISPLLTRLFRHRDDCAFIVATHDVMLPLDNPDARVLLVRGCQYSGSTASSWEADLVPSNSDVDESTKRDIVGARRRIVFVEGEDHSLDKPLYAHIFPNVSVRSKRTSREVEHAVNAVRSSSALHWVKAWGVIDNDGRTEEKVESLREAGIFAVPFFSVESIYYHPEIIARVAKRLAEIAGGDAHSMIERAMSSALSAAESHLERLAVRAAEKGIREKIFSQLPTLRDLRDGYPVNIAVDTKAVVEREKDTLRAALADADWLLIVQRCPIRETGAPDTIANALGLRNKRQYHEAVIQMLRQDADTLTLIRGFFEGLSSQLNSG